MDIPALPFSKMRERVTKPKPVSYPKELITIGDHLRAWRLDNGLLQSDVATILGVCEDSIVGWENMRYKPSNNSTSKIAALIRSKTS